MQDARGCLRELQELASSETAGNRDEMLDRVADLFFITVDSHGDDEQAVFGDVMESIAYELEAAVRARLAERMAEAKRAPRKLVLRLARDEIGVARPILEKSHSLSEDDLVEIAGEAGQDHLHAISSRNSLSEKVTDVIVSRGDETVLASVAENKGARFSGEGFEKLLASAREGNAELLTALEVRADVPDDMMDRVKQVVAERLKREFTGSATGVSATEVDTIVNIKAARLKTGRGPQTGRADAQQASGRTITEDMVLTFARARKLTETIQCLSQMSGVAFARVSHCLLKADLSALAVLCKACGFQNITFATLIQLRSATNPVHVRFIPEAMRNYDKLDAETARRAVEDGRDRAADQKKS